MAKWFSRVLSEEFSEPLLIAALVFLHHGRFIYGYFMC
jgi:hypothetical protein